MIMPTLVLSVETSVEMTNAMPYFLHENTVGIVSTHSVISVVI